MAEPNLTERQQKLFASVRASLERDTGKTMAQWVAIARTSPETGHRARLKWLKDNHGLLQNRASQVLGEAFGSVGAWSEPETLIDALWADPASRAIFEAIDARARALPEVTRTARKGYNAWSRKVQFAAARPVKGGGAMLGLLAVQALSTLFVDYQGHVMGAKMEGAIELAEEVFHMPVRLGVPQYVTGLADVVSNPIHATGVGLLLYAKQQSEQDHTAPLLTGGVKNVFDRMKTWFQGNF